MNKKKTERLEIKNTNSLHLSLSLKLTTKKTIHALDLSYIQLFVYKQKKLIEETNWRKKENYANDMCKSKCPNTYLSKR